MLESLNVISLSVDNPKFTNLQTLTGHSGHVLSLLKISEELMASCSDDSTIIIWKQEDGMVNLNYTLTGHSDAVTSLIRISDD